MAVPPEIHCELPEGLALDLLLLEVRQMVRQTATPFSIRPKGFDLPLDEALAVVDLSERGYSDACAWWLAREASVTWCVDGISSDPE